MAFYNLENMDPWKFEELGPVNSQVFEQKFRQN